MHKNINQGTDIEDLLPKLSLVLNTEKDLGTEWPTGSRFHVLRKLCAIKS